MKGNVGRETYQTNILIQNHCKKNTGKQITFNFLKIIQDVRYILGTGTTAKAVTADTFTDKARQYDVAYSLLEWKGGTSETLLYQIKVEMREQEPITAETAKGILP